MRLLAPLVASLLLSGGPAQAKPCHNAAAVTETRRAAEAQCGCVAATLHGSYMSCVSHVAHDAVVSGALRRRCKAAVRSCEQRSICGRPGYVTCCRTTAKGMTRCAIKRSARACLADPPKGGQAYATTFLSLCDACPGGRCTNTTTSSTTTTITLFDLGHTADITSLQESDARLLSQDRTAHWVLWDLTARRAVLEGDNGQGALAGASGRPSLAT